MPTLHEYISRHSAVTDGDDLPADQVSDLIFFKMRACGKPDADKIREAIKEYQSNNLELDLFDGKEHSYIQIGAWLGDQGEALMLMGLGSLLGFWELLTPYTVLGDACPEDMAQQMAGRGMITVRVKPVAKVEAPNLAMPDERGWYAIAERAPTLADCDKHGELWLWMPEHAKHGAQITKLEVADRATHWRRLSSTDVVPRPPIEVEKAQPAPPTLEIFGTEGKTGRGFPYVEFKDEYGKGCSIQESSRAVCENEDGSVDDPLGWIWLGIDDPEPVIMKTRARELGMELPPGEVCGWMRYPLPEGVNLTTRMHLNEKQVRGIIERLTLWLETGAIHKQP